MSEVSRACTRTVLYQHPSSGRETAKKGEFPAFSHEFATAALVRESGLRENRGVTQELLGQLDDALTRKIPDLDEMARIGLIVSWRPEGGLYAARSFARARRPIPLAMIGRNRWVYTAYMALLNPADYFDGDLEAAHQIAKHPETAAKLKALIIAGLGKPVEEHLTLVASITGFSRWTVEAFEILYFNVLDRHRNALYISNIVYPKTRLVEFAEDYIETTPIGDLLLRAAFNYRDIDLVQYLAGMTAADRRKEFAKLHEQEEEFRRSLIANGQLAVDAGLINQPGVGLARATALLGLRPHPKPGVIPGNEESVEISKFVSDQLATTIASMQKTTEEELEQLRASARPGRSYMCIDDEEIVPFDHSNLAPVPDVVKVVASSPDHIEEFAEPRHAIWRNKKFDVPVVIVARMSQAGYEDHYLTKTKSGIPASEVFFENPLSASASLDAAS